MHKLFIMENNVGFSPRVMWFLTKQTWYCYGDNDKMYIISHVKIKNETVEGYDNVVELKCKYNKSKNSIVTDKGSLYLTYCDENVAVFLNKKKNKRFFLVNRNKKEFLPQSDIELEKKLQYYDSQGSSDFIKSIDKKYEDDYWCNEFEESIIWHDNYDKDIKKTLIIFFSVLILLIFVIIVVIWFALKNWEIIDGILFFASIYFVFYFVSKLFS